MTVESKCLRKAAPLSCFDQFRRSIDTALKIRRNLKLLEGVQSPDSHKEVLGFDEKPVHGVPVLLRITQFELEPTYEVRNEFGNLHEGDVSTKACTRTKAILFSLSVVHSLSFLGALILTGIQ